MTIAGYVTNACLLAINYTFLNLMPLLLLVRSIQEGNTHQVVGLCVLAMGTGVISVCLVIVTTLYCLINYPQQSREAQSSAAVIQHSTS